MSFLLILHSSEIPDADVRGGRYPRGWTHLRHRSTMDAVAFLDLL